MPMNADDPENTVRRAAARDQLSAAEASEQEHEVLDLAVPVGSPVPSGRNRYLCGDGGVVGYGRVGVTGKPLVDLRVRDREVRDREAAVKESTWS